MRVASLFSGAGGLDLGLKQAGHQIILQCESDPGAQQVLRHNFPGILLVNDVTGLQTLPKETELLVAGFPCIDVSRAGLRKGFQGQSSGLVRHVFRLLEDAKDKYRPIPWVLLENVEALLDRGPKSGPPFVMSIVDSLEMLGYKSWAHRVVGSAGFGVPNRRCRVFILASLHGDARDVLLTQGPQACSGGCCPDGLIDHTCFPCYECYQTIVKIKSAKDASFALDLGNARSAPGIDIVPTFTTSNDRMCLLLSSGIMGMLRIEDAERLQGFPVGFTAPCYPIQPPGLNSHKQRPVKDSEVDIWESKRFALLGNAVTVQVGRWLGEKLMAPYAQKYVPSDRDMSMISEFKNTYAAQLSNKVPTMYDWNLDEFESFEGSLLVRVRKDAHPANVTDTSTDKDLGHASRAVALVDTSNQIMKKEFYGRKEMQGDAWPRAAWSIQGMGRFGVESMSESPVKYPFMPLGSFISEVGKIPNNDVINTYIMRLREQGWHVEGVIRKATKCGVSLEKEVSSIMRLEGSPDDPEQISELVWAPCPVSKAYWPAELLDPMNLPPTRTLPSDAVSALTREQKKQWLPRELWDLEDAVGGNLAFGDVDPPPKQQGKRKSLAIFFGDNTHSWVLPENALNFSDNLEEQEAAAVAARAGGSLKSPTLFFRALDEAKIWLTVKNKKSTRSSQYVAAVSARAARMAAHENKKPRCGHCEACLQRHSGGVQRRCLTVRAHAAAVAGHAGAQLSVYRERAIGAKVHVYWPLDQQWYTGLITDYDRIRLRHTVTYDDGDMEMIPLWSPCQLIRVLNKPKDWQLKAVDINLEKEKEKEAQRQRGQQRKTSQDSIGIQDAPLTKLEMDREATILRNNYILDSVINPKFAQDCDESMPSAADENVTAGKEVSTPTPATQNNDAINQDCFPAEMNSGIKSEQTVQLSTKRDRESHSSVGEGSEDSKRARES